MAGLVNGAIPGQPLGGISEAKRAASDAHSDAAKMFGRDVLGGAEIPIMGMTAMPAFRRMSAPSRAAEGLERGTAAASATEVQPGIRAYHGSPHDFDRFSMDRVGSGEGAQAYGHGLYFAEKEGVARSYRDALADRGLPIGNGPIPYRNGRPIQGEPDSVNQAIALIEKHGGDTQKALDEVNIEAMARQKAVIEARDAEESFFPWKRRPFDMKLIEERNKIHNIAQALENSIRDKTKLELRERPKGHMYEVNINAHHDHFLDWDKPVGQQHWLVDDMAGQHLPPTKYEYEVGSHYLTPKRFKTEADAKNYASGHRGATVTPRELGPDMFTGKDIWEHINKGKPEAGAKALREAGIPGIKYLDQGSRTAGEGSRNYVVFDDNLISILRKYGLLGMAGGAASMYGSSPSDANPAKYEFRAPEQ